MNMTESCVIKYHFPEVLIIHFLPFFFSSTFFFFVVPEVFTN